MGVSVFCPPGISVVFAKRRPISRPKPYSFMMRNRLFLLWLVVFFGLTVPAQAQYRQDVRNQQAQSRLYDTASAATFSLNRLFSPQHFRMGHSYEMSFGSFGGASASLGMYTNTMRFQFNSKLAGRVDLAYAFSPFGGANMLGASEGMQGRFLLRNAEIAYRPSDKVQLHFSVRQSPYGGYMSPYGYGGYGRYGSAFGYRPYYGGSMMHMRVGSADDLFWNDTLR